MRLITYNIAYGTGSPKSMPRNILTSTRYLRTGSRHFFDKISRFVGAYEPDILALVEVDTGSFRTGGEDQVQTLAMKLEAYRYNRVKYAANSLGRRLPILKNQSNAVLSRDGSDTVRFYDFPVGFKKLVIELVRQDFSLWLVHLALRAKTRAAQLEYLKTLIDPARPFIVTGDFNTLKGERELESFSRSLSLTNPNGDFQPTFPVWRPAKQLDFVLCSPGIHIDSFRIPQIRCSDHFPLILDFHTGD